MPQKTKGAFIYAIAHPSMTQNQKIMIDTTFFMSTHMYVAIGPSHHLMHHSCTFKQNDQVTDTKKKRKIYNFPGIMQSVLPPLYVPWIRTILQPLA